METLRIGWKGLNTYSAEVALKRKMAFPLFRTMKVWGIQGGYNMVK